MLIRGRDLVVPVYLLACLILGGSAQGIWQNMVLQLGGLAMIAWAAFASRDEPLAPPARYLLLIVLVGLVVVALQLIPLPPSIWGHLGLGQRLVRNFDSLGLALPIEPLSLNPAGGVDSLFGLIPPLAIICSMSRLKAYRPEWLAAALIAGTLAGIALGAVQVATSASGQSNWYLYSKTNPGKGVGFFANADHMATLLLMTLPFLAAAVAAAKSRSKQRYSAIVAIASGVCILVIVGLALNGSLAGYGLMLPVLAVSALIFLPPSKRVRLWTMVATMALAIGAIATLEGTAIGENKIGQHAASSVQSRAEILVTTSHAIRDFMPFGSGLGSFRGVYALYESPDQVTPTFVIHVHNDYAEVALELGLAGIIIIAVFLVWWAASVARVWRTAEVSSFARAASIASAAVLLHSIVDFPLRTAAVAACFGMCIALLADRRAAPPQEESELRPTRHVEYK